MLKAATLSILFFPAVYVSANKYVEKKNSTSENDSTMYYCYCTEGVLSFGTCSPAQQCGTLCTLPCYCPLTLPSSGGNVTVKPTSGCTSYEIKSGYYFPLDPGKGNIVDLSQSIEYPMNGYHPPNPVDFSAYLATNPPNLDTSVSVQSVYDPVSGIATVNRYCSADFDSDYKSTAYVMFYGEFFSGNITVTEEKASTCPDPIPPTKKPSLAPTVLPTQAPTDYNNYFCLCDSTNDIRERQTSCSYVSETCGYKCTGPCYCPLSPGADGSAVVTLPSNLDSACGIYGFKENSLIGYYYNLDSEQGNKVDVSNAKTLGGSHNVDATFKSWYVTYQGNLNTPTTINTAFSNNVYHENRYCIIQNDYYYQETVTVTALLNAHSGSIVFSAQTDSSCPSP